MSSIHYFDSHTHLIDRAFEEDRSAVLERALAAGVTSLLNICTSPEELRKGRRLVCPHLSLYHAAATHPHDAASPSDEAFLFFQEAAKRGELAAIGETGLDYHYTHAPKEVQQQLFKRYLHLAEECSLPVIFHCREAFSDLFAIADAEYPRKAPAILHCFTGTPKEAEGVLERGWALSMSAIVTFKKSETLREIVKEVPLAQLLLETDAPYLAPQSLRGKRNESSFLPETAACIAAVKGLSIEEIARITKENAERLFHR